MGAESLSHDGCRVPFGRDPVTLEPWTSECLSWLGLFPVGRLARTDPRIPDGRPSGTQRHEFVRSSTDDGHVSWRRRIAVKAGRQESIRIEDVLGKYGDWSYP